MTRRWIGWLSALLPALAIAGHCHAQSVRGYHGSPDRSGNFIVPALNWERARSLHLDLSFHPQFPGHLYAQPLYWQPPGSASGVLIVATESDDVHAIDARSGTQLWTRSLGQPVALSTQPCGNIDPLGITGTPVIDEATQAVYLAAMIGDASGAHHRVFALSLKDGAPLPGWPIDVAEALAARGQHFNTRFQNQRGALAVLDGRVYIPYGGHYGDCGDYHGWVLGISLRDPRDIVSWSTRGRGGGIWAPGGISSDGRALFVATGNTIGTSAWSDGEAVIRLMPDLRHPDLRHGERPQDFSRHRTGGRSMSAMPISAAATRCPLMSHRRPVPSRFSWRSARMRAPIFSTATISAASEAAWPQRSCRPARFAPRRQRTPPGMAFLSRSKARGQIARPPEAAAT